MSEPKLILASASPRRQSLLKQLDADFDIQVADIDETANDGESPEQYVKRVALAKAAKVAALREGTWVLGSDTCVTIDGYILGKPESESAHADMLSLLSGRWHQVHTAVALVKEAIQDVVLVTTDVKFASVSPEEINAYWQSGEPADKAGGYAIQGIGGRYIEQIKGSYSSVVGLPLFETSALLKQRELI